MRTIWIVLVALLFVPQAVAQEEPGPLARAFFLKVAPPNILEFEKAYAAHIGWHRQQNDTWRWDTWQRISGRELGVYVVRTPGHLWKDFDESPLGDADRQHFLKDAGRYVDSIDGSLTTLLTDVSRLPEGDATSPLISVIVFRLTPGGLPDFLHGITQTHEAVVKSERPIQYAWLQVLNGGHGPRMVLILFHKNWVDVKGPDTPFWVMIEEIYGRQGTTGLQELFSDVIESQETLMYRYREDLSYVPSP